MKNVYQGSTLNKSRRKKSAVGMSIVFLVILLASDIYGQKTIEIPMRDGIKLATDLYFPESENGPFPVILMRTPYNKEMLKPYGTYFSRQGFVFVIQDVRGRFGSQGHWEPFINEREDGYDSIEWLAAQDWSTGKIGMYGGSYSAFVQFAAAILKPPHLVTLIPNISSATPFGNMPYEGGVLVMGGDIRWVDIVENAKTAVDMQKKAKEIFTKDWNSLLSFLPVIELDKKILGKETPYGPNSWLKADAYPLPATSFVKYYISSEKGANTSRGDGALQIQKSSSTKPYDTYTYDPGDPSPCFIDNLKKRALERYKDLVGSREDILVYETAPFEQPLIIAGPLSAVLYASSSAKDTDWCVTLYAVAEDGEINPIGMTWGVLRARFRDSMTTPEFLEKDKVYEFTIDLSHTGYTFSEGERIRMEISSASFPEYSRNLNTGGHNEMETEYVPAVQRIYHTQEYPSHLLLPVIKMEIPDSRPGSGREDEASTEISPYAPYAGQYTSPQLGNIKVFEQNNNLALDIPKRMVLAFNDPNEEGIWTCLLSNQINLIFSRDDSGEVAGLSLLIRTRLPKKTKAETISADVPKKFIPYLGRYPVPAEGIELTVIFKDGNLAVVDAEGESIKLKGPDEKGLWIYRSSGYKISFVSGDEGDVKEMIIHQIFEAPKAKSASEKKQNSQKKEENR